VPSHHTFSHFYGAADENLDLHATLSLRHRNSILACTASWLSIFTPLSPSLCVHVSISILHACPRLPADMAFFAISTTASRVVSAGVTTFSADHRGCYLTVQYP
jgi:hypothetical protein